jgi:tetraacyldisaccharide 4'-kinase
MDAIQTGRAKDIAARLLRALTAGVEPIYRFGVLRRNRSFDRKVGVVRVGRPVVSIGNITTGGTGKTPVVCWLARRLYAAGKRPVILTRGYRGKQGVSDEAELLRKALAPLDPSTSEQAVPVVVNADRVAAAEQTIASRAMTSLFILDDGFQHRRVARDFDLVLIDATRPFGFDRLLPRGQLREPRASLGRADAILLTRVDLVAAEQLEHIEGQIRDHTSAPIFRCSHQIDMVVKGTDRPSARESIEMIAGKPVYAFCGLGNPQAFFESLRRSQARLVGTRAFADHHPYSEEDLKQIRKEAEIAGAERIMTTAKDAAKLQADDIWVAELGLRFEGDHESRLLDMVAGSIRSPGR